MSLGRRLPTTGGPLGGEGIYFHAPKGVLLLDHHTNTLWLYDWDKATNTLVARDSEGVPFDSEKMEKARIDGNYELISIGSKSVQPSISGEEMSA